MRALDCKRPLVVEALALLSPALCSIRRCCCRNLFEIWFLLLVSIAAGVGIFKPIAYVAKRLAERRYMAICDRLSLA